LGPLSYLDELAADTLDGHLSIRESLTRLDKILRAPVRFPQWAMVPAYGLSSLGLACIIQAGFEDIVWALIVGIIVGVVKAISDTWTRIKGVYEGLVAALAAMLVSVVCVFHPHVSMPTVILAGLITLLPGLSLTIALTELATQNLIAGTARLMGAGITLLKLVIGVTLGSQLVRFMLPTRPHVAAEQLPSLYVWLGLVVASISLVVIYQVRRRDQIWIVLAAILGFAATRIATELTGPTLGIFIGGFAVGLMSNLYARIGRRPATVLTVPGIVLLVPGSLGYHSLTYLVADNPLKGVDMAFQMFVIAVTLVSGILFANLLISPKRTL
jgi:uncharacterized membrane protein YjjB (DUF3815 family)